ncbi:hypothetical protein EYF80_025313 [Liparis tanakae]|uniref:Uncharacterized protein n=1 Tax=Liparis tanakae TaxID=230148 RepID=A0A4Z2HHZ8_9TELE|nr:hypothetical protein EYF80_025313 [Liparis tanakae]
MVGSSCSFRIMSREHCLAVLAPRGNRFRSNSIAPVSAGAYLFGFRGAVSIAGPGAGMFMGNISTHISMRPFGHTENNMQSNHRFCCMTPDKRGSLLPARCRSSVPTRSQSYTDTVSMDSMGNVASMSKDLSTDK